MDNDSPSATEMIARDNRTEFGLLGPLAVRVNGHELVLGSPKQRAVLAVLLLNANQVVSIDRIIDDVWGESAPRTVEHSIHVYISEIRSILSESSEASIETRPPGYSLRADVDSIDTHRFQNLVHQGLSKARTSDPSAADTLEAALDVWTGNPLGDFPYESFATDAIRELNDLRADALEMLASMRLQSGQLDTAKRLAKHASEIAPLREEPRRVAMTALYLSGRHADALREFGRFHELLAEELGIAPSEQLRDLEERILLQDSDLSTQQEGKLPEENPYRGLRPFTEVDGDVYFGREELVKGVLAKLATGSGLISIVGPSGSGKSSAARAGVVAALRSSGETALIMEPGAYPIRTLADSVSDAGLRDTQVLPALLKADPGSLASTIDRQVTIVVDQLEELFTLSTDEEAEQFVAILASAVDGGRLRFVVTLRADFFDRPLSLPVIATRFAASTMSLGPMSPTEIERAIVEPARRAGRIVEEDLLAQLVGDMASSPGALPLLQFSLFELFKRAEGGSLTLDGYRRIGGMRGALSHGANQIYEALDPSSQSLVEQLFVRMVNKVHGTVSARPANIRELLEIGVDRVQLQNILEVFADRRLVTLGRDGSGAAIVEMAHEFLISGWSRLGSWIEEHDEDLERLAHLETVARDWEHADRSDDYLLRGDRLQRMAEWRDGTNVALTPIEEAFVDSSIELRDRPAEPPEIIVWYEGRGDGSFGDLVGAGVDLVRETRGVEIAEYNEHMSQLAQIENQISRGTRLVMMLYLIASEPEVAAMISRHPLTHFVFIGASRSDSSRISRDNVTFLSPRNEEIGFLAGVAASLASSEGRVGFIGGVDTLSIRRIQAGYEQGAAYVDATCHVDNVYLTGASEFGTDMSGFHSTTLGTAAARYLRQSGADVLFHAAGESGWGMISYARTRLAETGEQTWCIGVDVDQHVELALRAPFWGIDQNTITGMQSQILTSIVWRLDLAITDVVFAHLDSDHVEDVEATIGDGRIGYSDAQAGIQPWISAMDEAIALIKTGGLVIKGEPLTQPVLLVERPT